MPEIKQRPTFASSFATALKADAEDRGWRAFIPINGVLCCAIGFAACWFVPLEFWEDQNWQVSTAVYGGLLAFNGLLLALGWSAFSRIYEIIAVGRVGEILKKNDLLAEHLAFVDGNHAALILSASTSAVGLLTVLMPMPIVLDHLVMAVSVATTAYALIRALASTRMMSDLVWEQAHLQDERKPELRAVEKA